MDNNQQPNPNPNPQPEQVFQPAQPVQQFAETPAPAPVQPVQAPQPLVPQQVPVNPYATPVAPAYATPPQQAMAPHTGLYATICVLCLLFCIPALIGASIYYSKYKKAAQVGDVQTASSALTAVKLWGFIGSGIGFILFLAVLANGGA